VIQENTSISLKNWELVSVNPNNKTWNWKDLFCFWGNTIQSIIGFSLIASLYLVYELNIAVVFFGTLAASLLVVFLSNLIGKPSQKHGIPFPVFLRTSMGIVGAKYVAILRGLVAIFMFGVQSFFLSKSFGYLIRMSLFSIDNSFLDKEVFTYFYFGLNIIDWFSFLLAITLQIYLFRKSQNFTKLFINFSAIFVYIGLILFCIIIASTNLLDVTNLFKDLLTFDNVTSKSNIFPFLTVFGTMFAYFSIVIVNFGDFSRFVKDEGEMKKGNLYGLVGNIVLFSFITLMITGGTIAVFGEYVAQPTDMVAKVDNILLTIVAAFAFFSATVGINMVANFIPPAYDLANLMPSKISFRIGGLITAGFGFVIGGLWVAVITKMGMFPFVNTLGAILAPVFGIMICDYYLIKNQRLDVNDLFNGKGGKYFYNGGFNSKAMYAWIISGYVAMGTVWPNLLIFDALKDFFANAGGGFAWIIGAALGAVIHLAISKR